MRIVVLGGTGYVGRHVSAEAADAGHAVVVHDSTPGRAPHGLMGRVVDVSTGSGLGKTCRSAATWSIDASERPGASARARLRAEHFRGQRRPRRRRPLPGPGSTRIGRAVDRGDRRRPATGTTREVAQEVQAYLHTSSAGRPSCARRSSTSSPGQVLARGRRVGPVALRAQVMTVQPVAARGGRLQRCSTPPRARTRCGRLTSTGPEVHVAARPGPAGAARSRGASTRVVASRDARSRDHDDGRRRTAAESGSAPDARRRCGNGSDGSELAGTAGR